MPGTYPAAPATLSDPLLTISRFLSSPTQIVRRVRDYKDLRFVSDQVLTQSFRSSGGAVLYEASEPFVSDRTVTAVASGSEYPGADMPNGTAGLAAVLKWGQRTDLTDEEVTRNSRPGSAADRKLRKLINSVIKQVDSITMSAVNTAITANAAATTPWATIATATPFYDISKAKAQVRKLNLGYEPDIVVMDDDRYAALMNNQVVAGLMRRENEQNPVYTGEYQVIAGLRIVVTPNLPVTSTVIVADSSQLGGMADEESASPGYAKTDMGVEVKAIRKEEADKWTLQGRRITVPVIQEPGAGYRITGA
jgi:hypothetical protein